MILREIETKEIIPHIGNDCLRTLHSQLITYRFSSKEPLNVLHKPFKTHTAAQLKQTSYFPYYNKTVKHDVITCLWLHLRHNSWCRFVSQ